MSDSDFPKTMRVKDPHAVAPVEVTVNSPQEARAVRTALAYMDAWNARDAAGTDATLHFPHVRFNGAGELRVVDEPPMMPTNWFDIMRESEGWDHSCWDYIRVLHSGTDKVHLDVQFTRYREDGSAIGAYQSVWIIVFRDGRWGIHARSSYAG